MPKRILFAADVPVNDRITGGVQAASKALFEGCEFYSAQYDIHVVSISKSVQTPTLRETNGIQYHFIPSVVSSFQRPRMIWNLKPAKKYIAKLEPDVINVIDQPTLALAAIGISCPRVYTIHGIKSIEARLWKGSEWFSHQLDAMLERYIHRSYDNFIAVSPYVRDRLEYKFGRSKQIYDIPNAVPDFFFSGSRCEPEIPTILNVGSFTRLKSQHLLLEAVKELQQQIPVKCILCGSVDDPSYFKLLQAYKAEITNLEIKINSKREEIRNLMLHSSILVHTSKQENTPMVFLEAMASRLPIISSRVGGISHLLHDDAYGTTYDYGEIKHMIELIRKFIEEPEVYRKKTAGAYSFVESHFHPARIAKITLSTLESII